ncbi:hypothetical protein GCM10025786_27020 [Nocardioides caeni]
MVGADGSADFVPVPTGRPLGTGADTYEATTLTLPPGATLLCFTDGLVERRTEDIDAGLARLASVAGSGGIGAGPLEPTLDGLLDRMRDPDRQDDIAVLALRRADSAD